MSAGSQAAHLGKDVNLPYPRPMRILPHQPHDLKSGVGTAQKATGQGVDFTKDTIQSGIHEAQKAMKYAEKASEQGMDYAMKTGGQGIKYAQNTAAQGTGYAEMTAQAALAMVDPLVPQFAKGS
jgi:hypothetical protein